MKKIVLILFLMVLAFGIQSQVLFKEGTSGFQIGMQFLSNDGSTLVGISPGYNANGNVAFGVGIGFESHSQLDFNSTAVTPFVNITAFRQGSNDMPVSLTINAAYQYNTSSEVDLTGNTISIGLGIIHEIEASKNLSIFPGGSVGWRRVKLNLLGFTEDVSAIGYGLNLTLLMARKLAINPALNFSEGSSFFSLSLGILFPR